MADGSGRKVSYGIAKETVRGTANTSATFYIQQLSGDLFDKKDKIYNESNVGVLNTRNEADIVREYSAGKLAGKVLDKQFGLILLGVLGSVSTATNADASTTVKDHTFTQSQSNTPQALTLFRKDGNSDKAYALSMIKTLEITFVVGEYVKFECEVVGKKGSTVTTTVSYAAENEFIAKHIVVKMATAIAGLAGATAVPVKSGKIKITRKVDPYYVVGSNDPNEIYVTEFSTEAELVLRYTDQTYENLWTANTFQAASVTMTNSGVTIGTSANPKLALTLNKQQIDEFDLDQSLDGIVEQTLKLKGLYNLTDSAEISAVLTNLQASY